MVEGSDAPRPALRFEGYVLDADALTLEGPEGPIVAEPRILEVLDRILAADGELVTKDELATAAWKDEIPNDGAIARAVHHARKAVGETGRDARILRTVHGRGFRAGVDVERLDGPAAEREAVPETPIPSPSGSADPARSTSRSLVLAAGLLAIALTLGGAAWLLRPVPASTPPVVRMTRVAIVPTGEDVVDDAACELLALHLERIPGVLVRDCELSRRAGRSAPSLARIAEQTGADVVVSGRRTSDSKGPHRLALVLSGVAPDGAIERFELPEVSFEASDPRTLQRIAAKLAREIGAVIAEAVDIEPVGSVPENPAVLAAAIRGLRALAGDDCGDPVALDLLRKSVREEPAFVPAWLGLAAAHRRRASDCGLHPRHAESALRALDRAGQAAPPGPQTEALRIRLLVESGRVRSAWEVLRTAEARRADPRLDWEASRLLLYGGFPELAIERLERARRGDPEVDRAAAEPAPVTAFVPTSARRTIERLRPSPRHFFRAGLLALDAGEVEVAIAALRPAFRVDPADHFARLAEGLGAIAEGASADARRILSELARTRAATGALDPLIDHRLAELQARVGAPDPAFASLGRAIDGGFHCAPCLRGPAWETLRTDPRFTEAGARAAKLASQLERDLGLPSRGSPRKP